MVAKVTRMKPKKDNLASRTKADGYMAGKRTHP
jgi:hypothetical protein